MAQQVSSSGGAVVDDRPVAHEEGTEYALHYAPLQTRLSWTSILPAYWALVGSLVFLIFGALVALTIGTVNAIIALAISVVLQGALYFALARYSIRSGVTSSVFSRVLFGTSGSALAALLLGAVAIFYGALESAIIAIAFEHYVGGLSLNVWYLIVAVYSVIFALGGIAKWLDRINWVLLPLYAIGLIVAVVWAGTKYGFDAGNWYDFKPEQIPVPGPPILFGIVLYMGVMVLVMFSWDYSRMARPSQTNLHRWVTFGPVYYFLAYFVNGVIGIFIVFAIPSDLPPSEISLVFNLLGLMGFAGLVFIWVSQTRINTANFYVAALSIESFVLRVARVAVPRVVAVVVTGAIVFALEVADVFSFIADALQYQAIFVVAWVGVAAAHVLESYRRRRAGDTSGRLDDWRPGRVAEFNVGGLLAWLLASGVGLVLLKVVEGTAGAWSSPVTLAVSFGLYWLWLQSPMDERLRLRRRSDPRTTVEDEWRDELVCSYCNRPFAAHEMDYDQEGKLICAEDAVDHPEFLRGAKAEDQELRRKTTVPA